MTNFKSSKDLPSLSVQLIVPRKEFKSRLLSNCCYAPQAYRLHFQNGCSASQARLRFLEKIHDNIAVSFLPDFESLSKKAFEKGLNYFTQGYIHNIKISEARGAIRVDARCWRSMRKSQDLHNLHVEIGDDKLSESYSTCKAGYINLL